MPEKLAGEITVAELIEWLKTCDPSLKVAVVETYEGELTTDLSVACVEVAENVSMVIIS